MKRITYLSGIMAAALSVCLLTTACGNNIEETFSDTSRIFSDRDLSGDYNESECDKITLSDTGIVSDSKGTFTDGSTVTITKEGNYILNGTLSDGMIIVDVDKTKKVMLVLNGVNINSASSAAIYVKNAEKVFITLADGTENILSNGGSFTAIDENNIDAVIFSKDDLTLNGTGRLIITSPEGHGIVSKDELVITNGNYDITASSHGISGKDSVAVADGNFDIKAGKDAIHSVNDDDDTMGKVYIGGGTYVISSESDAISALNDINIAGGSITVNKSYEGIEGRIINIGGGSIYITSSDDGLNAADKRKSADDNSIRDSVEESRADFFGGMMNDVQDGAGINISGGVININAEGDGIDSNGHITVSGGEIYVSGSSDGGNGAIDYAIDAVISGGVIVAAGQSGMAQNFSKDSTQGAILVNTQRQNEAGSGIALLDGGENTLVAWTAEKSYNSVVISCPEIETGKAYTLITGENATEITMDSLIYGEGMGFGFGAPDAQGDFGGFREPPEGMELPEGMEPPEGMKPHEGMEPPHKPE